MVARWGVASRVFLVPVWLGPTPFPERIEAGQLKQPWNRQGGKADVSQPADAISILIGRDPTPTEQKAALLGLQAKGKCCLPFGPGSKAPRPSNTGEPPLDFLFVGVAPGAIPVQKVNNTAQITTSFAECYRPAASPIPFCTSNAACGTPPWSVLNGPAPLGPPS